MDLGTDSKGGLINVRVSGRVDEVGAEELESYFKSLDAQTTTQVVLDFRGVDYIGSAGVGTLLLLYKQLAPYGGRISVINIPSQIYDLLSKDMNLGQILSLTR